MFDPLFMEEDSPAGFGYIDVMKDTQTAIDEMNHAMDENVKLAAKQRFVLSDTAGVNEKELADFSKDIVHVVGAAEQRQLYAAADERVERQLHELPGCPGERAEGSERQPGREPGRHHQRPDRCQCHCGAAGGGQQVSRDMLKSAYRAFAKECYLIIELMRQFYDEQRCTALPARAAGVEYATFSAQQLRAECPAASWAVQLGDHEPVFDIVDGKMNLQYFAATEATAASGRNREPRLGPWPAGHECA